MLSIKKLISKYGEYRLVSSHPDEIRFNCPYCVEIGKLPDRKFHLYININKGVGHCFRCGKNLYFNRDYFTNFEVRKNENLKSNINKSSLPIIPESISIFDTPAYDFLKYKLSHLLDINTINYLISLYDMKLCIDKRFKHLYNRIMIPIKFNNSIVGFQFRSIYGEEPKYLTLSYKDYRVKDYIFNFDNVKSLDKVIICEGIFDVLPLFDIAVAVFGKEVTNKQLKLLEDYFNEVIICFDGDAYDDAVKLAHKIVNNFDNVRVIKLPKDKDPGDLGIKIFDYEVKDIDLFDLDLKFLNEDNNEGIFIL